MWKRIAIGTMFVVMVVPTLAHAQFEAGDWELTLAGTGSNDNEFDGTTVGANGSLGHFLAKEVELSLRQDLGYTDLASDDEGSGSVWNASTRVALDYHFDLDRWQPFVGANIGYIYGESVDDTFEAAPEAGVKYFVNSTTFIMLMAEYQFFFEDSDDAGDSFDDGRFVYTLGMGFRW
jgi:hypothetical protein